MTDTSTHSDIPASIIVLAIMMTIGQMPGYFVPLLVGAASDGFQLNSVQAGLLGSIEIFAGAITTFVLSAFISSLSLRLLIKFATTIFVIAQLISIITIKYEVLVLMRALSGIGTGCFLATATSMIATSSNPEEIYGRVNAIMATIYAVILFVMPSIMKVADHKGLYLSLIVLILISIPLLRSLPNRLDTQNAQTDKAGLSWHTLVLLFTPIALIYISMGGSYSISERMAVNISLESSQIGLIIGASTIAGIFGSILAGWLGTRFGRAIPLLGGILVCGISCLGISYSETYSMLQLSLILYGFIFMFSTVYIIGIAAALDLTGRLAVAVAGFQQIAYSAGPILFGYAVLSGDYTVVGIPSMLGCVVSLLMLNYLLRSVPKKE